MFEVKVEATYMGVKFRFAKWDEALTFCELVLANGIHETAEKTERLSVTIKVVDGNE